MSARSLSLSLRVILLIFATAAPIFVLQIWQDLTEREQRRVWAGEQVRQLASLIAEQQSRFVETARALLLAAAQSSSVQNRDPTACRRFMQGLLPLVPEAYGMGAVGPDGVAFCSASGDTLGMSLADRPYVSRAIREKVLAESGLIVGRLSSAPTLNFAYPIVGAEGDVRGAVIMAFSVSQRSQSLTRTELPPGSTVELLDEANVIVARYPDPQNWIGRSVVGTEVEQVLRAGTSGVAALGLDGVRRFYHKAALSAPTHLSVTVGIPEEQVLADAETAYRNRLFILSAVYLLVTVVALIGVQLTIRRPIATLRDGVQRIESGVLDDPPMQPSRWIAGELAGLARSFSTMSRSLRDRDAALHHMATTLESQVEERTRDLAATNERLRAEIEQRERAESALRQAQKMEAIGQLTGGIAHDFNNLLQVILGSLNALRRRTAHGGIPESDEAARRFIETGIEGANRAATLTQRLLAFSRQQALQPVPVDPNRLIAGLSDLMRRTLGEPIAIETVLAGGLWRTCVDPNQLENALLNLVINARDAMPDGGKLTIETGNAHLDEAYAAAHADVSAGQYVMVAVSDTGTGMAAETIARAFEPFFTTKSVGQGSGLGLSMVYGFVKQSHGHIKLYSEPGEGTTVKIYLPRLFGPAPEPAVARAESAKSPMARVDEAVLVVEDDERVGALSADLLSELGYRVMRVTNATDALRVIEAGERVDLLFTDVGLPGMNGRKLADAARRIRPDLKTLFTTGYTPNAVVHNGALDPGVHLITKPFSLEALARKVRQVIDGDR